MKFLKFTKIAAANVGAGVYGGFPILEISAPTSNVADLNSEFGEMAFPDKTRGRVKIFIAIPDIRIPFFLAFVRFFVCIPIGLCILRCFAHPSHMLFFLGRGEKLGDIWISRARLRNRMGLAKCLDWPDHTGRTG